MKPPNHDDTWAWWQPLRLRMEMRKHMKPMTPDVANKRRLILSVLYCVSAVVAFHWMALDEGLLTWRRTNIEAALDHMNDATIIEMENFTIRKVTDYSSADFQDKIKKTNKPSAILD